MYFFLIFKEERFMDEQKEFHNVKSEILDFIFLTMRFEGMNSKIPQNEWIKSHIEKTEQYRLEASLYYKTDYIEVIHLRKALASLRIILFKKNNRKTPQYRTEKKHLVWE